MVLESLINAKNAEKQYLRIFLIGLLYPSIAIIVTSFIFKGNHASIVVVTLTLIACTYLMYNVVKMEEEKDNVISSEKTLLKEHSKAISFYGLLFLGFVISFALWYTFLPVNLADNMFYLQSAAINAINYGPVDPGVTGNVISTDSYFKSIFINNLKILGFSIFFSLLYGVGAIFILTWNASVLGTAVGIFVRKNLADYAAQFGFVGIGNYFSAFSLGLLRYALHAIPEVIGFFIGALAGGIISVAIIKREFKFRILVDSLSLIIIAIVFLFTAYLIEVYVTPWVSS
jgi:uncharacterized membrane protein SpoIIM required for sporulation